MKARLACGSSRVALLAAAVSAASPGLLLAQRLFDGGEPFPLGARSTSLALLVADFDGNGRPDLASAQGNDGVSVLLADPRALFAPARTVETNAQALEAGDFTGDGLPDLVVLGGLLTGLHLNLGGAEFGPVLEVEAPFQFGARLAAAADLDGDGFSDLVLTDGQAFATFLGSPAGSLREGETLPSAGPVEGLITGDFDGDGALDLVGAGPEGIVSHRGVGDGRLEPPVHTAMPSPPALLANGDFFRDGIPEAACITADGSVVFLSMERDGSLGQKVVADLPDLDASFLGYRQSLAAVDFDGDGFPDLVLARGDGDSRQLLVILGFGEWVFPVELDIDFGLSFASAALEDFDADGAQDAVVSLGQARDVVAFRGTRPGRLGIPASLPLAAGVRDLAAPDLNGDGARDLVAVSSTALHVAMGDLAGGHSPPTVTELPGRGLEGMAAGDLDGSGGVQLALGDQTRSRLLLAFLRRNGTVLREVEHETLEFPGELAIADLDGDAFRDVLVAYRNQPQLSLFRAPGAPEPPAGERRVDLPLGSGQTAVAAADLDADGATDIAAATREGLRVLIGDGRGGFSARPESGILADSPFLRAGDVDGDGSIDLVGAAENRLVIVHAAVAVPEAKTVVLEAGHRVRLLEIVDLDVDGRPEAVAAAANAVLVTGELAAERFEVAERYAVGSEPRALVVTDLEGDGRLDCAVGEWGPRKVSVFHGSEAGRNTSFRRGDADANGAASITDALVILGSLFHGTGPLSCLDAADADDSGGVGLTDAVFLLGHLFQGGAPPPAPGPEVCGRDLSGDALEPCRDGCR